MDLQDRYSAGEYERTLMMHAEQQTFLYAPSPNYAPMAPLRLEFMQKQKCAYNKNNSPPVGARLYRTGINYLAAINLPRYARWHLEGKEFPNQQGSPAAHLEAVPGGRKLQSLCMVDCHHSFSQWATGMRSGG